MRRKDRDIPKICEGTSIVEAHYIKSPLPEYAGNPFIEALPPEFSYEHLAVGLAEHPPYNESERNLPSHLRMHCIQRLFRFFEPLGRHYDIGIRLDMMMRAGYLSRNIRTPDYRRRLQDIYRMRQSGDFSAGSSDGTAHAISGSLIGNSGLGKTRSMRKALSLYPTAIWHPEYQTVQIPALVVECPHDGSVKQLCLGFFKAVDRILGTTYGARFGGKGITTEQRILEVCQIALLHAIGIIVFDELQHIRPAGENGIDKMMNFFVTLMNVSETPIVLVGTMSAQDILRKDFRQARRASGLGGLVWTRFDRDDEADWSEWSYLLEQLWRYQWTAQSTPLTSEFAEAIYEHTQGIVDLAVKLYVLSQYRAIASEAEELSVDLIRKVADDEFSMLKPMLDALASGDPTRIAKYDDLRPLDFERVLQREQLRMLRRVDVRTLRRQAEQVRESNNAQIVEQLVSIGYPVAMAEIAAQAIFDAQDSTNVAETVGKILKAVEPPRSPVKKQRSKKAAIDQASMPDGDLRRIAADDGYSALLAAGLVRSVDSLLVE